MDDLINLLKEQRELPARIEQLEKEVEDTARALYERVLSKGICIDGHDKGRIIVESDNFYLANKGSGCMGCCGSSLIDLVEASQIAGPFLAINGKEFYLLDGCTASDMSKLESTNLQELPLQARRDVCDICYFLIEIDKMYSPTTIHYFGGLGYKERKPTIVHFKTKC